MNAEAASDYQRLREASPEYDAGDYIAARPLYLECEIIELRALFAELARQ